MKTKRHIGWMILTLALLIGLAGGEAGAQSRFDGSADAKWVTAANWTPEAVPTASSNVVIGTTNAAVGATGSPMTATIGSGDTCAAANLTLGEHAFNTGTLTMDGGTLTFPAAGNINVAGTASSTGTLNQTGGTVAGITSGTLTIGGGASSAGSVTLGNNSSITSAVVIASATGASGTLTLTNSALWRSTTAPNIGSAANASGSLKVYGNGYADLAAQNLTFGSAWGSTGMLTVTDSGVVTNISYLTIGSPGYGEMTVSGTGKVYATYVNLSPTGGVSSVLTVTNSGYVQKLYLIGGGADGIATVTLCGNATAVGSLSTYTYLGSGARATGRLYVRDNAVYNGDNATLGVGGAGGANNSTGIVTVSDFGVMTNIANLVIGNPGYGDMTVSGTGKVYATQLNMNPTGGVSCVLTVTNSGYVRKLANIGGGADGIATVTLCGNATAIGSSSTYTFLGNGARATGRLYVRDNAVYNGDGALHGVGGGSAGGPTANNSTGIVTVSDFGVITNVSTLNIGYAGYGDMTVRDNGRVYTTYIYLSPTGGVSSSLTVTNTGMVTGLLGIGGGADGIATVTLTGNSTNVAQTGSDMTIASGARSTGRLYVRDNALLTWSSTRPLSVGNGVGSTGIVEVSDSGVITNFNGMTIGPAVAGYGSMTVRNFGKVYSGSTVSIGGTNNNSILTVADDGLVRTASNTKLGHVAGASGTLTLTNNAQYLQAGGEIQVGVGAGSIGWINVNGGKIDQPFAGSYVNIGHGSGATGIVTITSGEFTSNGDSGPYWASSVGYGVNSVGTINLQGGILREGGLMTLGAAAGAVGRVTVTGGTWYQRDLLNIGTTTSGTGIVTVANCVQTNIIQAIAVGGGTTVGDRYGSVTISNATFGGYAAATDVNVWTNGFVELTGTGSVFLCDTFTVTGGSVTNRVRQFSGGVDVLNNAAASLVITNGGKMHLAFEEIPSSSMTVWGLRWAGNNRSNDIQRLLDRGVLTWTQAAGPTPGIQTNATHTWFGYTYSHGAPPAIDQGDSVTTNINEDAGTVYLTNLVSATDGDSGAAFLSWTNTTVPASGTVACSGTGTNPATFTYTATSADFYGTNSFLVRVMDEGSRADSITVTVVVAAINDPPVNTTRPAVSGTFTPDGLLTGTSGTWNDTADTNFGGSSTLAYAYEWQTSATNDGTGVSSLSDYDTQYTVQAGDVGNYVRVQVTCTNEGVGTPQYQVVVTNSDWYKILADNANPVIDQAPGPLATNMTEDGGTFQLTNLVLTAADADGDPVTWTSITAPDNGTVSVNGTGTNQVTWTAFTYTPNTNFYGTNSFVVQAADGNGGYASITVEVAVAAVNDAPVNTALPGFAPQQYPASLSATNGVWNDDADTNATYTYATFTNGATFGYQWWRADSGSGANSNSIADATNQTYALTKDDRYKWFRVAVACTDAGVPGTQSATAWSSWVQETSAVPTVVVFTNALNNGAWGSYSNWAPDAMPTTNITAVIGDTSVKAVVEAQVTGGDNYAKNLYVGTNASSGGTVTMTGGTLTFPAAGNINVAGTSSSTGTLNQTGGTVAGITSGKLTIGGGASSVGSITLGNNSSITSEVVIASATGASGTLTLTNSAQWKNTAGARNIGSAAGAVGGLAVYSSAFADLAAQTLTLGSAANSTGMLTVADSGVVTNVGTLTIGQYTGYGELTVSGTGKVYATYTSLNSTGGVSSLLTVTDSGYVNGLYQIGAGADGIAMVTLSSNATVVANSSTYSYLGSGARATGRLYVRDMATYNGVYGQNLNLGNAIGSTGIVVVSGNGVITNGYSMVIGVAGAGYGSVTVSNFGKIFCPLDISIGGTNNNSSLTVADDGQVRPASMTYVGNAAGASGTLTVTNNGLYQCGAGGSWMLHVGAGANSIGWVNVNGGTMSLPAASKESRLGSGTSATGVLTIAGGVYTNADTVGLFSIGYGVSSVGRVDLQGGKLYLGCPTTLGAAAGAVGSITNTGGTWVQFGTLGVGITAGGTGLVTVANTVQTNITGAVTVGGGTTPGDRYGSVTISNATFGGSSAMTVLTNGFVELTGTGSVVRCSTFTCRGGTVTNRVRQLAGGLDVTGATLTVTNGGAVYLSFDEGPAGGVSGDFWGLRWAGNRTAELAAMTNANALAWGGAAVSGVGIYTNATHTMVGYFINTPPVVTNAGKTVTINMSEDGSLTPATLYATDAEGDTLIWTNGTVAAANGSVGVINVASSNLTTYTYAPAGNWNGTDTFTVHVSDGRGGVDAGTVTVVVAPVNDPPICTVRPTVSGLYQFGLTLSNDFTGAWSDAIDTDVSGSSSFTFTWQWQRADSEGGSGAGNITDATNVTYLLGNSDTGKYVRVEVTCTDDGVGSGGNQSVTTNTPWTLVTVLNDLPVITNGNGPLVVNLTEDGGATDLLAVLNLEATDTDSGQQDTLVWTNMTGSAYGTMTVSGTGSNPAAITYTPNADWNGTNTFVVRVTDTVGGFDEIGVEVRVAAVNDAPVCTVTGTISGPVMVGSNLTVTAGTWNDNIDTNVSGSSSLTLTRQWKRNTSASSEGATDIIGATALTYTLTGLDRGKFISVLETCVDTGVGGPGPLTNTAYSTWLQETSAVPALVVFNKTSSDWDTYSNWTPDTVPVTTNTTAVIGDTGVLAVATASIASGDYAAKNLYVGTNTASAGTLTMTGGTLTFPAAGNITVAGASTSTGTLNQTGGTVAGITNGALAIAGGVNSVGSVTLGNNSSITSSLAIASAMGASGTLTLTNSARWRSTGAPNIGSAAGAAGRLGVYSNAFADLAGQALTLGSAANSTGMLTVADSGVMTNVNNLVIGPGYGEMTVRDNGRVYTAYTDLNSTGGVSCALTVTNFGFFSYLRTVGGVDGTGTVTLAGNATAVGYDSYQSVGFGLRSVGRMYVRDNAVFNCLGRPLYVGQGIGSTGIVVVSGNGMMTNFNGCTIGYPGGGYGSMTVANTGRVYVTGGGIDIGGTNNNSILTVADDGFVWGPAANTRLGVPAGASGTLTVTNNGLYVCGAGSYMLEVGVGNNSIGWVNVNGGTMSLPSAGKDARFGVGTGATGILTITSGVYSNANTSGYNSPVGLGPNSVGIVNLQGGTLYDLSKMQVGFGAGSVGRVTVTGGNWDQRGILEIGTQVSSTGLVTVANCVSATNITAPITVGGGTTVGDRYGSVTISNATFGGSTAMTVWTNGFVELTGIGSVLRVNTLTCNGGMVTNYVQGMAGGVDVTDSALTSLVVTNGARMHLVFQRPSSLGAYWGLKWAGNRATQLQGMTNSGALSWDASQAGGVVEIFTNATHTMVGYVLDQAGTTFRFR